MRRPLSTLILAGTAVFLGAACGDATPAASSGSASAARAPASSRASAAASVPSAAPATASGAPSSSAAAASSAEPASSADGGPAIDDGAWSTKTSTTLETDAGPMVFHAVHHGTLYVEVAGKVVWVDPWSQGKLDGAPPADFILLTDTHPDHLDPAAITKLSKPDTVKMGPKAVVAELPGTLPIANGETKKLGPIEVTATPMYNEKRGPEAGKLFHDKGRGNGYVLSYGGKRVYISGDTECTSEMKALEKIDLAFVCMNLPYTMPPDEAAACIAAFKPKVVVPFHHRGSDLKVLEAKLAGSDVKIEKLDFY